MLFLFLSSFAPDQEHYRLLMNKLKIKIPDREQLVFLLSRKKAVKLQKLSHNEIARRKGASNTSTPLTIAIHKEITMAKLHVAQIEYLSQELIDHVKNANNLIGRGALELDRAQKTLKMLVTIQDQWISEMELNSRRS